MFRFVKNNWKILFGNIRMHYPLWLKKTHRFCPAWAEDLENRNSNTTTFRDTNFIVTDIVTVHTSDKINGMEEHVFIVKMQK